MEKAGKNLEKNGIIYYGYINLRPLRSQGRYSVILTSA